MLATFRKSFSRELITASHQRSGFLFLMCTLSTLQIGDAMYRLEVTVRRGSRAISTPVRESAVRDYLYLHGVNDVRFSVQIVSANTFVLQSSYRPLMGVIARSLLRHDFIVGQVQDMEFLPRRHRVMI